MWFRRGELREVVLAIQELLEVVLDGIRIKSKRVLALSLFGRVPSVEWSVSSIDSELHFLQDSENSFLGEGGKIREDDAGPIELVRLDQGLEYLRV